MKELIENLDIKKGDIVLVTEGGISLFTKLRKIGADFDNLINKLIEKITPEGTLLFPTFNWDFCRGKTFDILKTKSQTSYLGEIARKRNDFIRTKHPIYSFAVTGKYKKYLLNLNNIGAFSKDSPFAFLHKKEGKMISFDVSIQHSFTFVHYVEEIENVWYRYHKDFTAKYVDYDRKESIRTYSMFVRDIDKGVVTFLEPLENLFIDHDIMKKNSIYNIEIRQIDLKKAFEFIRDDIRYNEAKNLYRIQK